MEAITQIERHRLPNSAQGSVRWCARVLTLATLTTVSIGLVGCGGGGGGGDASPSSDATVTPKTDGAFPVDSVIGTIFSTSSSFSAVASTTGAVFTQTFTPLPTKVVILGKARTVTEIATQTVSALGAVTFSNSFSLAYSTNPVTPYQLNQPSRVAGYTLMGSLPSSASAGESGPLVSYTTYELSTSDVAALPLSNSTVTWSVEADTASTAFVCLHLSSTTIATGDTVTEVDCYRIDSKGTTNGTGRFTLTIAGRTTVFAS